MSSEERAQRAWVEDVNRRLSKPLEIDGNALLETMNKADQSKANIKAYEAAKAAEKRHLEEIARNPAAFHDDIRNGFNKAAAEGALKAMLNQVNKQINANMRREQALIPRERKNKARYDHLEELLDIDYKQLIEARAERTKAELIEDYEQVEELNKEIKSIEERMGFYNEQMKSLAAEETGEDGSN